MSVTSIRLRAEVETDLQTLSNELHRSKNWLINQAIREYIARQASEQTRWNETLTAIESVANGNVISGQAVHAWLESWGTSSEQPPPQGG